MERMLIEDNEEIDKDGNKEDNNNPGKMDLNDDSISDDNDDNNSSHSNIFSFGYEAKDNQVIIKYIQIFNFESFLENLSSLMSPCILINDVINKEILNIKIKQNSDNIKIPLTLFEKIKEDDIEYLMNINHKKKAFNENNGIIFSSILLFNKNNTNNDDILFKKLHDYLTGFSKKSNISDFSFDKSIYFPFSYNNNYYAIIRKFTQGFRVYHYYDVHGKILYHFGAKGVGKSICSKAIIFNYLHFKLLNGKKVFFPSIFFDTKLWSKNINNREIILFLLKYELLNLFENVKEWKLFYEELIDQIKIETVYSIIEKFINLYYKKYENKKLLIIIDHYSSLYDINEEFSIIKNKCLQDKKYDIYIIYEINNIKDQLCFINHFIDGKIFINSEDTSYNNDNPNYVDLDANESSCYYKYDLKNFETIKKYFDFDYYKIEIPNNYESVFGENVSYFFKFISSGLNFDDFLDNEKQDIKKEILNFISSEKIPNLNIFLIITKIIVNENKEINYDYNLFKYLDGNYFIFHKIKTEKNIKYRYTYSFPLIRIILEEIMEYNNNQYFIDIKSEEFRKLDGAVMGVIFDQFMNHWFIEKSKEKLFEFNEDNIEIIKIDYLIKKNSKNMTIKNMFCKDFVKTEIKENKQLNEIAQKYSSIGNKSIKDCIIVFQKFNAKSIDILFIIKRNKENDKYSLNNLQVKCSDSYTIDDELLENNRYEMTYLKNKIEMIFNIEVSESFITYVSIFEIKKKCALQNRDKFFYYSIDKDLLVDNNNNPINKFPFLEACKISFIRTDESLNFVKQTIKFIYPELKYNLNLAKKDDVIKNNNQKENTLLIEIINNVIYIKLRIKENHIELTKKYEGNLENSSDFFNIEINK